MLFQILYSRHVFPRFVDLQYFMTYSTVLGDYFNTMMHATIKCGISIMVIQSSLKYAQMVAVQN